jgi:hypothetical protein
VESGTYPSPARLQNDLFRKCDATTSHRQKEKNMLDIQITRTTNPKAKPVEESKLRFGKVFSDHMFVMDYSEDAGWHDPRIVPYQPFALDPASVVFHYAQEIFEGLKAYRTADKRDSALPSGLQRQTDAGFRGAPLHSADSGG